MIPKVAHVIWLGPPLPDLLRDCVDSFHRVHPDWKVRWWDEKSLNRVIRVNRFMFNHPERWVDAHSKYQFMSDVARFEVLNAFGGVYIDTDFMWADRIDPHLWDADAVTVWERQGTHAANALIGATSGHPVIRDAVRRTSSAVRHKTGQANRVTGPSGMWTDCVLANKHRMKVLDRSLMLQVPWYRPEDALSVPDGAIASHLWFHQRQLRGMS